MTKTELEQVRKLHEELENMKNRYEASQRMLEPKFKPDNNFKISYNNSNNNNYHEVYLTQRGREAVADTIIMLVANIIEKEYKEAQKEFNEFTGTKGNRSNEKE